jgi:molybdopterin/thiamine biosynthesis adenylyltransferase/acyl carrier protein
MVGEIYVRTAYSTSGYLNDPGLNAERFIKNPFSPGTADIIYKTGDLGRELDNGEIEILGRVDRQVKIRGLRIELGEIENQLLNHPEVSEAAVTIKEMDNAGDYSESVKDKHLCAYIVPVEGEGKLSGKEKVRYQRQMLLDGWGIGSQERLKSSMVFVVGAGGTGSPTLMQLALCGFGTIVVCDDDVVDLSNLNRQFMHDETRIGMNKALSAKKTIKRINPHINVIAYQEKVTRENLDRLAADAEIIFDCVDDLETKFILSEYAAKRNIPHIVSVMIDISSYVAIFHPPVTPCFSCIHDRAKLKDIIEMKKIVKNYKKKPFSVASPSLFVSTGAAVNEALKIILGFENPAYSRFLFFNHKGSAKIVDTEGYRQQTFSFSDHFRNICKEQGFDWDEGWRGNFLEELIITPDLNCPVCSKAREDHIDAIDQGPLRETIDVESEEKEPFAAKSRKYLSGILPDYMIPSFFIPIEKIPLTPNGKIEWNALPEPGIGPGDNYTAPGTETEKKLAAIWSEALGIGVGINDNFFESGGHSLKAAHMIARIHQELKIKLPLAEVFKSPTVRQLAAVISNKEKTSHTDIRGIEEKEFYPLSYNQRRIWRVKQANPNDIFYNTTGRITFPHRVDEAVVKRVLFRIMARHEGLRTSFREKNGQPVQIIRKSSDINMPLRVVDISALETNEKQQERERIFVEETRTPFDLSRAPLFRTVLVKLGPEQYDFIYTTYHIIADGWSLEVLRKDFLALYQGCRAGQNIEPEPLKVQCKEFAAWQVRQLEDPETGESAHRYWRQKLKEGFSPLRLPYDFKENEDTPRDNDNRGIIYRGVIEAELKEALRELAAKHRTSLFMVMFSLFNLLLARLSGQKDIVCRIPTAGRNHASLHPVVGHLMNPIFVKNRVEDNDESNFINFLRGVDANTREALQHQWYPIERALEDLQAAYPEVTASFNMLNMYEGAVEIDLENFDSFHRERAADERFPLTLQVIEYRNAVEFFWRYQNTLFKPDTIEHMAARYNQLIERVTKHNK